MADTIAIEVAYATLQKQKIISLEVVAGDSIRDAVKLSGMVEHFPEIDIETSDLGVFGKSVNDNYQLEQGDRIEIYRPLIADPKEVRRQRAAQGLKMKKGGGAV